jgi:hypothetical protein
MCETLDPRYVRPHGVKHYALAIHASSMARTAVTTAKVMHAGNISIVLSDPTSLQGVAVGSLFRPGPSSPVTPWPSTHWRAFPGASYQGPARPVGPDPTSVRPGEEVSQVRRWRTHQRPAELVARGSLTGRGDQGQVDRRLPSTALRGIRGLGTVKLTAEQLPRSSVRALFPAARSTRLAAERSRCALVRLAAPRCALQPARSRNIPSRG